MKRLGFVIFALLAGSALAAELPSTVVLETSMGPIVLELNHEQAPVSAKNFVDYVEEGHYDGLIFHRVISGFMVQGGGYDADYEERRTRDPIQNESRNGLSNLRGTIAMARTPNPHSATCQFFINHADNTRLDASNVRWGYAVFGRVVEGMEVVDAIAAVETGADGPFGRDVPAEKIVIESARVLKATEDTGASKIAEDSEPEQSAEETATGN